MTEYADTSPAVTYQAPAPVIEFAEHAVTDTASASADVYVAPAPAASHATPTPVILYAEHAVTDTAPAQAVVYVAPAHAVSYAAPAPAIEYAADPAVTNTAPAPVNNMAPAPAVSHAAPVPVIEYAADHAVTYTAPAPVNEHVAPVPAVSRATPAAVIEYAADHAVTCTAPAPLNKNVASALSDEEYLVDLPEEDKVADPLRSATIKRVLDGVVYCGEVEEIEEGKVSHDRLYRVKYTDGDIEHFTADQVKEMSCPLQDFVLAKQAQAPHDHLARNVRAPEDRRNAEHTANAVKRDIAESPAVAVSHATPAPMMDKRHKPSRKRR